MRSLCVVPGAGLAKNWGGCRPRLLFALAIRREEPKGLEVEISGALAPAAALAGPSDSRACADRNAVQP